MFGGASVTIPLKEDVFNNAICQILSESAQMIQSVNTLYKLPNNQIYGDNTDWIGIANSVMAKKYTFAKHVVGVVFGAGGTARAACYALRELGCEEVRVWNRTATKAQTLSERFSTCKLIHKVS